MKFSVSSTLISAVLLISLLNLTACSDNNNPTINPFAYPAGADSAESNTGDDTLETASTFTIGNSASRTIWPQADTDFYAVELTADVTYEFSANQLCSTCDVYLYLYDATNTELDSNDDYVGYDSRILYTPTITGTYYLEVRAYDEEFGIAQYTFGARTFIDTDNDTVSAFYDCNDNDNTIYLNNSDVNDNSVEIPEDGIDQTCNGVDQLLPTTADNAEIDNTPETALNMVAFDGYYDEVQYRTEVFINNSRTLHDENDEDWFTINVAPFSKVRVRSAESSGSYTTNYFESDATTSNNNNSSTFLNTTDSTKTYFVRLSGSTANGAWVVLGYENRGQDLDNDGFYNRDNGSSRDCNDDNNAINPDATEIDNDSIDSDCDGLDNLP